jgi:hypothetical protein
MEEVRAGQGAKLYGRFNHDAGMTVSLTDAMFKLDYIAMQVGSKINYNASKMYSETLTGTTLTLTKTPVKMGKSCGLDHICAWYREVGCDKGDNYEFVKFDDDATTFTISPKGATATSKYIVTYFIEDANAREAIINANFVPAEMILFLTAKLFAGDATAPETGKPVGEITVKIPRFQLDGTFDLSMAMSSAATMSLNGTVLAVDGADGEGVYAEVVEVIDGSNWFDNLKDILVSEDDNKIYAIFKNGNTMELDGTEPGLEILPSPADTSKITNIKVDGKEYHAKSST